ncbi:MAG: hypothetical protein KAU20_03850 [Nanoarchaeota archaeon]|nr:hypothetical protein [Nanoarchaeota archaeon]
MTLDDWKMIKDALQTKMMVSLDESVDAQIAITLVGVEREIHLRAAKVEQIKKKPLEVNQLQFSWRIDEDESLDKTIEDFISDNYRVQCITPIRYDGGTLIEALIIVNQNN